MINPEKSEAQGGLKGAPGLMSSNRLGDSSKAANLIQEVSNRLDQFSRLQRAFDQRGWNLYNLWGDSLLAVHRTFGVSQVCHSVREAQALLRRIEG